MTFSSLFGSISCDIFTLVLIGVEVVSAASAAVPPLASATSATVTPARLCAADPSGHRQDSGCARLQLSQDDAVDAPVASGRRTEDQASSLMLNETCDVFVGG